MVSRTAEVACASAWSTYLLLHQEVNEDDDRNRWSAVFADARPVGCRVGAATRELQGFAEAIETPSIGMHLT